MTTHREVVEKVLTEIQLLDGDFGVRKDEVRYQDFPFTSPPSPGIVVSPIEETEGDSTNETSDIGFRVQVVRAYHKTGNADINYGLAPRVNWRKAVFDRFNRVRLGFRNELLTRAAYQNLQGKDSYDRTSLDTTVVMVTVWIRQGHQG